MTWDEQHSNISTYELMDVRGLLHFAQLSLLATAHLGSAKEKIVFDMPIVLHYAESSITGVE